MAVILSTASCTSVLLQIGISIVYCVFRILLTVLLVSVRISAPYVKTDMTFHLKHTGSSDFNMSYSSVEFMFDYLHYCILYEVVCCIWVSLISIFSPRRKFVIICVLRNLSLGPLVFCSLPSIFLVLSIRSVIKSISSANLKFVKISRLIFMPRLSQFIILHVFSKTVVNSKNRIKEFIKMQFLFYSHLF